MALLDTESPLMEKLTKVSDYIIINALTILFCIPVITAGAGMTALHYCALKLYRDEETFITKMYFKSFKENFKQATAIWLILLGVLVVLGLDYLLMYMNPTALSGYISIVLLVIAVLDVFTMVTVFPVLSKFCNTVPRTIKTALLLSVRNFHKSAVLAVLTVLPPVLAVRFYSAFPLFMVVWFSLPAFLTAKFYSHVFKRYEDKYFETHEKEDLSADDEHIFSDEPMISDMNKEI